MPSSLIWNNGLVIKNIHPHSSGDKCRAILQWGTNPNNFIQNHRTVLLFGNMLLNLYSLDGYIVAEKHGQLLVCLLNE